MQTNFFRQAILVLLMGLPVTASAGDGASSGPARMELTDHSVFVQAAEARGTTRTAANLSDISRQIAGKVYYAMKDSLLRGDAVRIAVVAAVPLADLKRETEFGRVWAEHLLTDLADRGLPVVELRIGRELTVLPQSGEFIMTRNVGELAQREPVLDYVMVSTYSNTRKDLIVQGRLVDLRDGLVRSSWRYSLPLGRELSGLFHDTVEAPYKVAIRGVE